MKRRAGEDAVRWVGRVVVLLSWWELLHDRVYLPPLETPKREAAQRREDDEAMPAEADRQTRGNVFFLGVLFCHDFGRRARRRVPRHDGQEI